MRPHPRFQLNSLLRRHGRTAVRPYAAGTRQTDCVQYQHTLRIPSPRETWCGIMLRRWRESVRTYKPDSVPRQPWAKLKASGVVAIYLASRCGTGTRSCGTALPPWSCGRPGDEPGAHSPSIWPCSGWGLTAAASPQQAGRSCRPISPLHRGAKRHRSGMFLCHFPSSAPD